MAEGGEVLSRCATNEAHEPGCEYYADGGIVIPADQVMSDAPGSIVPESDVTPDSESTTEQIKAGLEGAAQGVAGPIAPMVEKAFGVQDEDILRRQKDFPVTHGIGETAGFVGSAFVPGGQAKVLGKLGQAASKAVGLGEAASTGAKIASSAVSQAVEMAMMGGSNEVSKMIVNDPDSSSQSAMANIGLYAALGGISGAALGSISPVWEATAGKKVAPLLNEMKAYMGKMAGETEAGGLKKIVDPFTKEIRYVEGSTLPKTRAGIDPFTKEPLAALETKVEGTTGAKLIEKLIGDELHEVAGKSLGAAAGLGLGDLIGGGGFGALAGSHALGPLFSKVLKPLLKPLLDKEISPAAMKSAIDYGMAVVKGAKAIGDSANNVFKASATQIKLPTDESIEKMNKVVDYYDKNPEKLMKLDNGQLGHYLPDHQAMIAKTSAQAIQYLQEIKPQPFKPGPLDKEIAPSEAQMSRYNRALSIAQNPLIVMQSVKDGTILTSDLQDLSRMYPSVYKLMSAQLSDTMTSRHGDEETIPYNTRIGLSLFLGQPVDNSMTPASILAAQPKPKEPPQAPPGGVHPKPKNKQTLGKTGKSYQTPGQAAESDHSRRD